RPELTVPTGSRTFGDRNPQTVSCLEFSLLAPGVRFCRHKRITLGTECGAQRFPHESAPHRGAVSLQGNALGMNRQARGESRLPREKFAPRCAHRAGSIADALWNGIRTTARRVLLHRRRPLSPGAVVPAALRIGSHRQSIAKRIAVLDVIRG